MSTVIRATPARLQVIVGLALWSGHWYQYVGVHRSVGVGFVLVLWIIAVVALIRRANPPLAAFAIAWGIVIAALGFSQQRLLVGDLHWIVRVLHLVVGIAAMPIAERLARPRPESAT